MRGLQRLIKLLEKNAISEIGEAESEVISKLLTDLLDPNRTQDLRLKAATKRFWVDHFVIPRFWAFRDLPQSQRDSK